MLVDSVDGTTIGRLELGQIEHGTETDDGQRDEHQNDQAQFAVPAGPPAERHGRAVQVLVVLGQQQTRVRHCVRGQTISHT